MKRLALVALLAAISVALADKPKILEEIHGKVLGVIDGDTITLHTDGKPLSIRLEGIDAPETAQKLGPESREALKTLVANKEVTIQKTGVDKYKRTLGIVIVGNTDVCAKMVEDGWAWHFKKYSTDETLAKLEKEARDAKRGLWQETNPTAPWDFREQKELAAHPAPAVKQPQVKSEPAPEKVEAPAKAEAPAGKFWLTTASGIRHNSGCQFYAKSKGGPCGANDGVACKKCGG